MTSTLSDRGSEIRPVVLLGATGRLGAMLRAFWPEPDDLICQSRRQGSGFVVFDPVLDPDDCAAALDRARAVVCLFGVTPARARNGADVFSGNTDPARATLDAAARAGAGRVFLASSAAVYGGQTDDLTEMADCRPISDYGRAKLAMEAAAAAHPHPSTSLRIGNVAGADAFLGGWHAGFAIDRFADGASLRRSYIGPRSLAHVIHALCGMERLPGVLNVAAPGSVSVTDLLDAAGLGWSPRTPGPQAIQDVTLDTARLEARVDFAPDESTPEGIAAQWREFQRGR